MEAAVERFGFADWQRWLGDRRVNSFYYAGRWDEAFELADRLTAEGAEIGGHYLEAAWLYMRARILLGRGHTEAALGDTSAALERARRAYDPQMLVPVLAWAARIRATRGEGGELLDEIFEVIRASNEGLPHTWFVDVARALVDLDRADRIEEVLELLQGETTWLEAGVALVRGTPAEAAEVFAAMGARPDEAEARLLDAERLAAGGDQRGAERQLAPARAFFESVGADWFLRRADAVSRRSA
jgi:tetratricopeptide (TPR) repeat protein